MAKNTKKDVINKKNLKLKIIVFLLICAVIGLSFIFTKQIESFINFKYAGDQACSEIDESGVVVHFIDVNQADAIAIQFPNGKTMLIDTGDSDDESKEKLIGYLDNKFFVNKQKVFDYLLITHSDSDHVGGAVEIYQNYQVYYTYYPDIDENKTPTYNRFINAMKNEPNSEYETHNAGDQINIGDVNITLYSPFYNEITTKTNNNQSPIMILSYSGKKIMFTGDAREDLEKDVLKQYPDTDFDVDVLKVGHHGSKTSSCKEFLEEIQPEYAVISCGEGNPYGHPKDETLQRLNQIGINDNCIYRTDKNGNIIVSISSNGELAIKTDNSTYVSTYIKWVYIAPGIIVLSFIIIFIPSKLSSKKSKKKTNKS